MYPDRLVRLSRPYQHGLAPEHSMHAIRTRQLSDSVLDCVLTPRVRLLGASLATSEELEFIR
jgi:hypothetical protein